MWSQYIANLLRVRVCAGGQGWRCKTYLQSRTRLSCACGSDRSLFSSRFLFDSTEFVSPVHARTSGSQYFGAAPGAMQGGSRQCSVCRFHVDVVYLLARCSCASQLVGSVGGGRATCACSPAGGRRWRQPPSSRLANLNLNLNLDRS